MENIIRVALKNKLDLKTYFNPKLAPNIKIIVWQWWEMSQKLFIEFKLQGTINHIFLSVNDLICDKDFMKALFGEEDLRAKSLLGVYDAVPVYLFHMQQCVISDDKVKYLEDHIISTA